MIRLFSYSLSLRLLAIFLLLAALFAWGVVAGIRWAYSADDLRTVISGHLSLHIDYVRQDIGITAAPRPCARDHPQACRWTSTSRDQA